MQVEKFYYDNKIVKWFAYATMLWIIVFILAFLTHHATAQFKGRLLRFGCSQLVIERVDPIVNPGISPSAHTHQVVGGNSFNATVRYKYRTLIDCSANSKS